MKILAYRGKSVISRLIQLQTRSVYSHIAIELDNGSVIEAWAKGGVTISDSYSTQHTPGTVVDVFKINTTYAPDNVHDFLMDQIGKEYDFISIMRFLFRRKAPINGKWFCSELCAAAFRAGSLVLQDLPESYLSPRDIAMSPLLEWEDKRLCIRYLH